MLSFTETAREMVLSYAAFMERPALRIVVREGASPLAPDYDFLLIEAEEAQNGDIIHDAGGFTVVVDAESAPRLEGRTVDHGLGGFALRNPSFEPPEGGYTDADLGARVKQVLDERINPGIASHGGEIALVDVRDNTAFIEMRGGCQGCAMSRVTLRQGVERMLRETVPEILAIQDITDHAAGENPFY